MLLLFLQRDEQDLTAELRALILEEEKVSLFIIK